MISNLNGPPRSGALAWALAAVSLAFGPLLATASAAPDRTEGLSPLSWFEEMDAYFAANPELKTTPHSGYNPFMRAKWFTEQRMLDGRLPAPDARWKAWQQKQLISASAPGLRANTWFSLGPTNFAGRMLSMDFDPNNVSIIYAGGADGGIWKSTNAGASWNPISDELPSLAVGGLAVSKTNSNIIVACTGEPTPNVDAVGGVGILRSTDGGSTWITTGLTLAPGTNHGFHFALSTATGAFIAGASDGLWRSSDDGATWTQIRSGGDYYDGAISPADPATIWTVRGDAIPGSSVKVSTNDGLTWTKAGTGQPASLEFGKCKLGVSGTTVYCAIGTPGTGGGFYGVIRSTDNGATWTDLSTTSTGLPGPTRRSAQTWYNLSCAADPNNSNRVLIGMVSMYRSGNGGASFTNVSGSQHPDHHVLMYEPGSNIRVWSGNDGGIYLNTSDGAGSSWSSKNSGLVTYQFYDICTSNDTGSDWVAGGTQDNGTDIWSGTTTWSNGIGADGMVCNIGGTDSDVAYGEIQFGDHRKSTNRGGSYSSFNSGLPGGNSQWVVPVALDYNDNIHLLTNETGGAANGIYRSTNGSSWSQVATHTATWIDISRVNGLVAYSISGSTVHTTTDNGNSWTANPIGFTTGGATKVLADPVDVNKVWATFSSYSASVAHVAVSTDQGASWTDVTGNLPAMPVNAIAVDPNAPGDVYVGTDLGVWFTRNGGVNWYPVGDATMPNAVVVDLEIRDGDNKLVAGTHGRGAWELDIPAMIENDPTDAPSLAVNPELRNLMLDRPWPNPVSDRTLLRYAARSGSAVSLKIYDVNGRIVSDLEDFAQGDGVIRTTPWFTDDVPSGVYFAVLQAGSLRKSEKITVIR